MIDMDFESKSRLDINCGVTAYASHESTRIQCLRYSIDDGQVELWSPVYPDLWGSSCPRDLFDAIKSGMICKAHNASFERAIWYYLLTKKLKWPDIPLEQWWCTAAKVAHLSLPRALENLPAALGLLIEKDKVGYAVMMKMKSPKKITKKDPREWYDSAEDYLTLFDYCGVDVEVEKACDVKMPELPEFERRIWLLDQEINDRGMATDNDLARIMLDFCERFKEAGNAKLPALSEGRITAGFSVCCVFSHSQYVSVCLSVCVALSL